METDQCLDESVFKKGRHRKKQLYKSILNQMEFYFSDSNLTKERLLGQLIQNDPYVDISIFLNFNKIRKLTSNIDDVTKAISKSNLIELSEDKTKVRRKTPVTVKQNVDECTIYVERLKSDATHEWLTSIFSEFGKVVYVSIPKYPRSNIIKGFAFVEFDIEDGANAALQFFDSIDCKIPSLMEPQKLYSIATFDHKNPNNVMINSIDYMDMKSNMKSKPKTNDIEDAKIDTNENGNKGIKRLLNVENGDELIDSNQKKLKTNHDSSNDFETDSHLKYFTENGNKVVNDYLQEQEIVSESEEDKKRKKQKKMHKKRALLKKIGLHVLSKKDWKKMRNKYLEMQKKTMTELKKHLCRQKSEESVNKSKSIESKIKETHIKSTVEKFSPGLIVKIALVDPLVENKKLKDELKTNFVDIQYVDIPHSYGCQEIHVRFKDSDSAKSFCATNFKGNQSTVLEGEEESKYWQKIEESRNAKLKHTNKKQRGRDRLLKMVEKRSSKHIHFDD